VTARPDRVTGAARPDPARAELDARVLAWIREGEWKADDARFDALARELFAFQLERCPPYARFCAGRGRTAENVASWREIPAVPAGAFKEVELRSFAAERTLHTFRTSGTSTERRGELHLDRLDLYEASLVASFERCVLPDLAPGERLRLRVLAPSPEEAPDSSLSHMFGRLLAERGDAASGFDVVRGELRAEALAAHLEEAAVRDTPVALCGTAFAFVHLLDALARGPRELRLPPGSRVMETGGFKGRSREVARDELHGALASALGVPRARIVNQYGMTELGSQFHDSVLRSPSEPRRKLAPPWTRVRLLDPETDEECAPGAAGRIAILDLVNTGSVAAVLTADLGRSAGDGFEVLGREAGAEARGCSLAADAMLERAGR
jgi:hypothetical protein